MIQCIFSKIERKEGVIKMDKMSKIEIIAFVKGMFVTAVIILFVAIGMILVYGRII